MFFLSTSLAQQGYKAVTKTKSGKENCLQAGVDRILQLAVCDEKDAQLLEPADIARGLFADFKASSDVPSPMSQDLKTDSQVPTTLQGLRLDASCGDHVVSSFGFKSKGSLGLEVECAAASTYGEAEKDDSMLPGWTQVINRDTCHFFSKCLEASADGSSQIHSFRGNS